jgi:hypothetical protein
MHKWSAVKSPLGAQTVLGDRHDPICEILLQVKSAACGTRPRELSNPLGTQTDSRKHCRVEPLKWATRVVFRHWLPISTRRACESWRACGTRPRELFNPLGTQTKSRRNRNTSDPLLYPRLEIFDGCFSILALVRCCRRRRWRIAFR